MTNILKLMRFAAMTLLALAVSIFVGGYYTNPWKNYLSLSKSFHLTVWNRGLDSRLVIFSDKEYGPYRGSTIGFDDGPQVVGFGDKWGIYYRHIESPDSTLWTLMLSIWYPIVGLALILLALVRVSTLPVKKGLVTKQNTEVSLCGSIRQRRSLLLP